MKPSLHISKEISLPADDIAGKKIAVLGTTGSGKTFAAMKLAEELLGAGIQTVALDVVGVWYGLRVSKDGKGKGFPMVVFGGLHGDIPITPDSGALVADIVVDRNISAVIDISQMDSDAEAGRFATNFAKQLFQRRKSKPAVTMVFLEECQEFVPENPVGGSENMKLHAFTRMVKIGRNFGIGVVLISQRPQEVSKRALNLSECVFAFQMNGRSEREAVKKWLRDSGADDVDVDVLPTLPVGVAHLWSPRWLKISKQVHILPKKTYDSSGTPDFDMPDGVVVRPLLPADIEKITASMAATIEKAKADDPAELRRKISTLEASLKSATSRSGHSDPEALKREFDRGADSVKKVLGKDISRHRQALVKINLEYVSAFDAAFKVLNDTSSRVAAIKLPEPLSIEDAVREAKANPQAATRRDHVSAPPPIPAGGARNGSPSGNSEVGRSGLRRMLVALAQNPQGLSDSKLGLRSNVSVNGGSFDTYLSKARTNGWISGDRSCITITHSGLEALGSFDPLPTGRDLLEHWISKLGSSGASRMLRVLSEEYPGSISAEDLGEKAGVSVNGGSFDTYLSKLRGFDLITGSRQSLRASSEFFA